MEISRFSVLVAFLYADATFATIVRYPAFAGFPFASFSLPHIIDIFRGTPFVKNGFRSVNGPGVGSSGSNTFSVPCFIRRQFWFIRLLRVLVANAMLIAASCHASPASQGIEIPQLAGSQEYFSKHLFWSPYQRPQGSPSRTTQCVVHMPLDSAQIIHLFLPVPQLNRLLPPVATS